MDSKLGSFLRIFFCVIVVLCLIKYHKKSKKSYVEIRKTRRSSKSVSRYPPGIPNLGNRNVIYNRIEKCGSRSLISIAVNIADKNRIRAVSDHVYKRHLEEDEILELQHNITGLSPPTFYERHVFYIDFEKFNEDNRPIYINVLRDPIERFVSHFNYEKYGDVESDISPPLSGREDINECVMKEMEVCNRKNSMMFNMGVYLCGMEEICRTVSRERVEIAKRHIDENYAVIGLAEEFNATLLILEWMIPRYFKGATEVWKRRHETATATKTIKKDSLTEESKKKLREVLMKDEYEVYYHAKRKFERLKKMYDID